MSLENYEVLAKIGSGKYASVYKVRRTEDQQQFALKRVPLDTMTQKSKNKSVNQAKLLQKIKHNSIISLEDICYDESNGHLCLILQLADTDLSQEIERLESPMKEEAIWSMLVQISSGLDYLHGQNILHRDIKTSNILLFAGGIAKISDLNVSTTLQKLNYTRTGTLSYASPQIWKGETYDSKSDIWSLGCLVYEMMTKERPFDGQNLEEISRKIVKCQYPKIQQPYSKQLKDLISFMIQLNPRLRPSAKTITTICSNRIKSASTQTRAKRLKSLTPFLQRQHTQTAMLKNPSSNIHNMKKSDKKCKKIQIVSHILRKSINTCKNTIEQTKQKGNTTGTTHFYKRVITCNNEQQFSTLKLQELDENQQESCKNNISHTHLNSNVKTIKFLPKRLNKLAYQKPVRRNTEL